MNANDYLAKANPDVQKKMSAAKSADDLVSAATAAGLEVDRNSISSTMRAIAGAELKRRGFPEWAINSVFLGETVCW